MASTRGDSNMIKLSEFFPTNMDAGYVYDIVQKNDELGWGLEIDAESTWSEVLEQMDNLIKRDG